MQVHADQIAAPAIKPSSDTGRREHRWRRLGITLWCVLAVAHAVKTYQRPESHTVYPIFSQAARNWWAEQPLHDGTGFLYSPTFAIALTPFGLLPNSIGGIIWSWCSLALLVYSLRTFCREVLQQCWPELSEGKFLTLSVFGSIHGTWSGQSNALVIALLLLASSAIVRRNWWTAAWLLATPIHIKLWPAIAAGLLCLKYLRTLPARIAACGLLLALVPFATKPASKVIATYEHWLSFLATSHSDHRFGGYRDAWTVWETFVGPVHKPTYQAAQVIAGLAVFAWCVLLARRKAMPGVSSTEQVTSARLIVGTLSVWVAWQMLFGPGTERLTYGAIAPVATWSLLVAFQTKRHRVLAATAWLCLGPLATGEVEKLLLPLSSGVVAMLPIGATLLAVWSVLYELTSTQPAASASNAEKPKQLKAA